MKKILLINNFLSKYGGAEGVVLNQASLLNESGNECYFFSTDKAPLFIDDYKYLNYFPKFNDSKKLSLTNPQKILQTFYNTEAKNKLSAYINHIKPDVALIHNFQFNLTSSVIDCCKQHKLKTILFLHDPRCFCPGGTLSYNDNYCHNEYCIKGNPAKCLMYKCKNNNLKASILASLNFMFLRSQKIFEKVDTVLCPSQAIKDLAVRSGVSSEKLHVISNYIENNKLNKPVANINGDHFLYVGRLSREKGVHYLIEAMKKTPQDIKLRIVGEGEEKDKLQKLVEASGLFNITFTGYKSGEALKAEYSGCLATILPCNWFENNPLTLLESLLYGKPAIAANIGGIPEIIEHNVNGLLFEAGNVQELAQSIEYLWNNKSIAKEMGFNGRKKAEEFYNQDIYLKKLSNILLQLII